MAGGGALPATFLFDQEPFGDVVLVFELAVVNVHTVALPVEGSRETRDIACRVLTKAAFDACWKR